MKNLRSIGLESNAWRWAAACVVALAMVVAWPGAAAAGRKRIVILELSGPKAEQFQKDLEKLLKKKHSVVTQAKWDAAADDLGAGKLTDKNVQRIAAKINVDGVVLGKVEKRGSRFYLHLQLRAGASGKVIAKPEIVERQGGLGADGRADIDEQLMPIIGDLPALGSEDDEDEEADDDEADDPPPSKGKGKGKAAPKGKGRDAAADDADDDEADDDDDDRPGWGRGKSRVEDDEVAMEDDPPPGKGKGKAKAPPRGKGKGKAVDDDDDDDDDDDRGRARDRDEGDDEGEDDDEEDGRDRVADRGDDDDGEDDDDRDDRGDDDDDDDGRDRDDDDDRDVRRTARVDNRPAIDLAVGLSFTGRRLSFTTNLMTNAPQGYDGAPVPGLRITADAFPLAMNKQNQSFTRNLGLQLVFDRALKISSTLTKDGTDYELPTVEQHLAIGVVYRHPVSAVLGIEGSIRFNKRKFVLDKSPAPMATDVDIPNTDYSYIDPGIGVTYALGPKMSLGGDARFLLITGTGEMSQADQYGAATVTGFDLQASFDYKIAPKILIRASAGFATIGFAFKGNGLLTNNRDMDATDIDVSGARDTYFGGSATGAYLF